MNVSRPASSLIRLLVLWVPLAMPCCVAPSSKTDPGETRSNASALSIEPASSFLVLQEGPERQGPADKFKKKQGPYITRLTAFTNYYPEVTIKNGKKIKSPPITIAPFDQADPAPIWWAYTPDANGTVTIGAEQGIFLSVNGVATPNGAHFILTKFDIPGEVHFVLKNGDQNGPIVHESDLPVRTGTAEDEYQLVNHPPGTWKLIASHHEKKVEITVDYVP